jgi:hypothetical protein
VTWEEVKAEQRCNCPASDAWRCARALRMCGQIACHCRCHKYVQLSRTVNSASPDGVKEGEGAK